MELYLYDYEQNHIEKYQDYGLENAGPQDIIIYKGPEKNNTESGASAAFKNLKLTKAEMDQIIKISGFKNICSNKSNIYTPELLLIEKSKSSSDTSLIKLGDDCITMKNGIIQNKLLLEISEIELLKKINEENSCIFNSEETHKRGTFSLNKEIIDSHKKSATKKQMAGLALCLLLLCNLGLILYGQKLKNIASSAAPVQNAQLEEYERSKNKEQIETAQISKMSNFNYINFQSLTMQQHSVHIVFKNQNMLQISDELSKIRNFAQSAKITSIEDNNEESIITVEVVL